MRKGQEMFSEAVQGKSEKNTLKLVGFKALLGWHYLVLFSPLLLSPAGPRAFSFFFERQLTLYCSIALAFVLVAFIGKSFLKKNKTTPSPVLLWCVGAVATCATILSVFVLTSPSIVLHLAVTVILGFSEAFLMFLWLHYYQVAAGHHLYRSLAIDMIFGAFIGFIACILQSPFSLLFVISLPLIASASLIFNWQSVEPQEPDAEAIGVTPESMPSQKNIYRHFLKTILPTVVFAFVFGLLQGGYIENGITLLMASDPLIILGIAVCGCLIFAIPEDPGGHSDIDILHRLSMLLFVLGILGLLFFGGGKSSVVSEAAIMAGFNLFDFGALILGIGMARRLHLKGLLFIDGGRALTYFSLATGLLVGRQIMLFSGGGESVLYLISGIAIALLVATSLTPFREPESFDQQVRAKIDQQVREKMSFSDGGVAAETVVPGVGLTPGVVLMEKQSETRRSPAGVVKIPAQKGASVGGGSSHGESQPPLAETPWRRVCHEIAQLYKLSARETEVFLLIAKGRNAEYIQQELVISTHTAKTHIANIYHKLGVHSSQEMLSLIESFKAQGKTNPPFKE